MPPNATDAPDGQCYCNSPECFYTGEGGARCAYSPGYVFGSDGVTCVNPFENLMASEVMGFPFVASGPDFSSICDGVECPAGRSCVQTVFGAECR